MKQTGLVARRTLGEYRHRHEHNHRHKQTYRINHSHKTGTDRRISIYILSLTIRTILYVGPHICLVRTTYLCCKDHLSFCGFIRIAYLCCKDHPSFCCFKRTAYKDHLSFCRLLTRQGGPTNMNSLNMLSNLDRQII